MSVSQQNEIDCLRIEIERSMIFAIRIPPTLEHAAVHQKAYLCRFNQVARPGDFSCAAQKGDLHGYLYFVENVQNSLGHEFHFLFVNDVWRHDVD